MNTHKHAVPAVSVFVYAAGDLVFCHCYLYYLLLVLDDVLVFHGPHKRHARKQRIQLSFPVDGSLHDVHCPHGKGLVGVYMGVKAAPQLGVSFLLDAQ